MKKHVNFLFAICLFAGLSVAQAQVDWSKLPPASTNANLTYTNDILPIFKASCIRCHGDLRPRAQLNLNTLDGVLRGTENGPVLKPGDSQDSLLVKAVSQLDPKSAMPPKPRARRGPGGPQGGPGAGFGTNAPNMQPRPEGGPESGGPQGGSTNTTFQTQMRRMGPPTKPLTAEQVGLVRAWIDQGAK
jgi:hypothetical protein